MFCHLCHLWPQSYGLYLGVWAKVKRRLCRLMLRFISSFLNSSGEFRGDPRGESLGEILGDPPGEPVLDLGKSWMMGSLATFRSCGVSSTSACSSSELSEHSSLMVNRGWSAVRYFVLWSEEQSLILSLDSQINFTGLSRHGIWKRSVSFCGCLSCLQGKLMPLVQSLLPHIWTKPEPASSKSLLLKL